MPEKKAVVSLRTVAERVGLAPCSVSAVLNNTSASLAIPQRTKERVFRAARELNYRPNFWARSLRTKRTRMVAVTTPDIGRGPVARVVAGVQSLLHRRGYLLALGAFDCASEWNTISDQLQQRGIEGVIAIDAILPQDLNLPVASVDLEYMNLLEPLGEDMQAWLSEWGASAAETVLRQIEKDAVPRRVKVAPKRPNTYFDLPNAVASAEVNARERA
ncbi:MAG TPA: LacI family DNA-binding transcriptional regulator [Candidatus Sulfotelmatobacter sp.]|nr:LacI family DNA-binding transcriptional regulator [Candidatus Sulfotelmatobacter sp.]